MQPFPNVSSSSTFLVGLQLGQTCTELHPRLFGSCLIYGKPYCDYCPITNPYFPLLPMCNLSLRLSCDFSLI